MTYVTMSPIMSLTTFVIGFIVIGVLARVVAEVYIARTDKSPSDAPTSDRRVASVSQQTIQRYYNEKGA